MLRAVVQIKMVGPRPRSHSEEIDVPCKNTDLTFDYHSGLHRSSNPGVEADHEPDVAPGRRRRGGPMKSSSYSKGRSAIYRGALIPLVLFAMLGSGCTAAQAADGPARPTVTPFWMSYQRPATSGVVMSPVRVPTRDGTELGCVLFRPAIGAEPEPGRFPVIVSNFWPYYNSQYQFLDPAQNPNAQFFAERGYADLVCSMRGTHDSSGVFPGWFMPTDVTDDYDLIEWAARQPWSNGIVGQEGASYGGINTLKAAAARPPHLVAIAPQFAFENAYLGYFYPGGIPNDASQSPAPGVTDYRGVTPEQQNATWSAHPLDDGFWRQASVPTGDINVPTLMVGGWNDYMVLGDIANYKSLPPGRRWLVMGPWEHASVAPSTLQPMLLVWFDHWLKRLPDAHLPSARVTSFQMPEQGGRWTTMATYPPANAEAMRFDLRTDQTLDNSAGPAGTQSYAVDPHDGPPAICFPPGVCNPMADMASADAHRLTFTSTPFNRAVNLIGGMQVHLRAALSATDGNIVVKVMDVGPDGTDHQISVGYLKASHRLSQSHLAAVIPGEWLDLNVTVWPTDWLLNRGHRLRISLTSGDYPKIAPDAPAGTVTVATGKGGSFIELTTRP
ncbi:MAG: CocE/NonD family hydrolase [Betaproteobacteria bacterium]